MADNVVIPATGSGTATPSVATDDVGGVHFQKVKLDLGGDGVSSAVSGSVPINDNAGSLTVDGSVTANAGTNLNTSLLALEAGGNLATVAGAVRAEDAASADAHTGIGALAVRKATPANTSGLDGDYEFLQMSAGRLWASATIDAALPAGANAIGKLAANDGVDIGDVTINNGAGASAVNVQDGGNSLTVDGTVTANQGGAPWSENITQWGSAATSLGQKVAASSVPVVLASDQSVIPVSDNSGSLTVDGSVTVTQATASNLNATVVGTGTFAVQDSEKIADNGPFTDGTTKVQPVGYTYDDTAGTALTENDIAAARIDSKRAQVLVIEDATTRGQKASVSSLGALSVIDSSDGIKDSAVPTYIAQVGGSDGSYLRPLRTSAIGNLKVDVESMPALDLEGADNLTINVSPGDEKFTVQGSSNAIPVPVSIVPNVLPGYGWIPQAFYAITTTVQTLKPSGGEIGWYYIYNPNASVAYVQFFDTAGNVTLGTTVPKMSWGIPASSGANSPLPSGISFMYGIRLACTTTAQGNTAPGTGLDLNFGYK